MINAETFVDAATHVCDEAHRLGLAQCAVQLECEDGSDPLVVARDESPFTPSLVLPLIGASGTVGSVSFASEQEIPIELERALSILTTELSVWCALHGIGLIPNDPIELSARQLEIARLAARGLTNLEIAEDLGISVNTVKVRLKQVFARLDAQNRTELVHRLARMSPLRRADSARSTPGRVHTHVGTCGDRPPSRK